jgi:hypothetical protein
MSRLNLQRIQVREGYWIEIPTNPFLRVLAQLELALCDPGAFRALRASL